MPRNSNGVYTLPAGNPVISGEIIKSEWANNTAGDLGNEMTDSLSRSGEGGMLAPLRLVDGAGGAPGLSWISEITMGLYRFSAGDLRIAMGGADVARFATNIGLVGFGPWAGMEIFNSFSSTKISGNYIMGEVVGDNPSLNIQNVADSRVTIGDNVSGFGSYLTISSTGLDIHRQTDGQIFNTRSAVQGSLWINNQATGAGMERVLTTGDAATVNFGLDGVMNVVLQAIDGNSGAPGLTFKNELTTGLYRAGTGDVRFMADGTEALQLSDDILGAGAGGIATPTVRVPRDATATLASVDHPLQAGATTGPNIRFGGGKILAANNGATAQLDIQNIPNADLQLGPSGGGFIFIDGNGGVTLGRGGSGMLSTQTASNGGALINNTKTGTGYERALTESDKAIIKATTASLTLTNSTATINVSDLTFNLLANKRYKITGMFRVNWSGTGADLNIELAPSSSLVTNTGAIIPDNLFSGAVFSRQIAGVLGYLSSILNVTSGPSNWVYTIDTVFEVGASNSTLTVNFYTPVANANTVNFIKGSYLQVQLID